MNGPGVEDKEGGVQLNRLVGGGCGRIADKNHEALVGRKGEGFGGEVVNVTEVGSKARGEIRHEVGRKENGEVRGYVADGSFAARFGALFPRPVGVSKRATVSRKLCFTSVSCAGNLGRGWSTKRGAAGSVSLEEVGESRVVVRTATAAVVGGRRGGGGRESEGRHQL